MEKKFNKVIIVSIIGIVLSVAIMVLAVMQLFGIWKYAINVMEPLMGLLMLINAYQNWKQNRLVAYFSIGVAIFIFIVSIVILFK